MFVVKHFIDATALLLYTVLNLYKWIIIIAAVLSWVRPDPYNPIVRFLYAATEPVLYRVRKVLPLFFGGIDFTPLVVIFALEFLQRFLVPTLLDLGRALDPSAASSPVF
ncbi:MAG TPA: YggT family protein [Candidatus Bathyarchaeia archaeon]|nr:YggT family protein [Candidatus Bathyarchaeia archaeon]